MKIEKVSNVLFMFFDTPEASNATFVFLQPDLAAIRLYTKTETLHDHIFKIFDRLLFHSYLQEDVLSHEKSYNVFHQDLQGNHRKSWENYRKMMVFLNCSDIFGYY